jgi:hypothetical protein
MMFSMATNKPPKILRDVFVSLALILVAFLYFSRYCDDSLFSSDAADYLRAADCQFPQSYLDTRSIGLWGAIKLMRAHPEVRAHLWDYLDRQNDAGSERHWHVAAGFYPNAIVCGWAKNPRDQRLVMAAEGALIIGIVDVGLRFAGVEPLLAILAGLLTLLSPSIVATVTDVSPHPAFMISMLVAGFALARYVATQHRVWATTAAAALAISIATLELSIVLAIAFLMVIAWGAFCHQPYFSLHALAIPGLVFVAVLIVVWPGGILHGSYFLSYGVFIFQALIRRNQYFGHASVATTILKAGQGSPLVLAVLVAIALGTIGLLYRKKFNPYLQVFSLLALGFLCQGLLNRFAHATYLAHFALLSWILGALCVQQWIDTMPKPSGMLKAAVVAAGVALVGFAALRWPAESSSEMLKREALSDRARQVIDFARQNLPQGAVVVSNNYCEIWRYYLPEHRIEHSADVVTLEPRAWVPLKNYWVIADPELLNSSWIERLRSSPGETVGGFLIFPVETKSKVALAPR